MGINFVRFNRRENRCSLVISEGYYKSRDFKGAVKIEAATAENRVTSIEIILQNAQKGM